MKHLILLISVAWLFTAATDQDARKANEAYERGDYAQAAELYRQALDRSPDDSRLHFNLANALARSGQAQEAIEHYERFRSLSESPEEQSLADYNIGNLMVDQQQLEEAVKAYREALRKNPADNDARHNYELALRQQQQQEQQQPDPDPSRDDQDDDQDRDDDSDDQQQDFQQDQQPDSGESPPDQDQEPPTTDMGEEMTREEAEQVLDALEQRERDLLRDRKKPASEEPTDEKDW